MRKTIVGALLLFIGMAGNAIAYNEKCHYVTTASGAICECDGFCTGLSDCQSLMAWCDRGGGAFTYEDGKGKCNNAEFSGAYCLPK